MPAILRLSCYGLLFSLLLSNCTVYAPMLPATPQLRDKGQAEIQATTFLNGRWEGGATYSPLKHVLVRAAGGFRSDSKDTTYFRIRQYEVGLGGYYPLGKHFLLSGMAGFGQATSRRGYQQVMLFNGDPYLVDFNARYNKLFGEVAFSYYNPWVTAGTAFRITQARFRSLTFNNAPLDLHSMTRIEPLFFLRVGSEEGVMRWLQVQVSGGLSGVPISTYTVDENNPREFEYNRIRRGQLVAGISLIFYPHRLARPTP